eukprot:616049-Amorphochlora_amoeboformis.AAC.1
MQNAHKTRKHHFPSTLEYNTYISASFTSLPPNEPRKSEFLNHPKGKNDLTPISLGTAVRSVV